MNYTKTLRNYCLQNPGKLFDVGFMAEKYFPMIPYKSYLKILNRLQDEKILTLVSKGVYLIGEGDVDEAIRRNYMDDCNGMTVGRQMLYEQGIVSQPPEVIEIRTRGISSKHKTVGKYRLTYTDLYFGEAEKNLIRILNIIEIAHTLSADEQVACAQFLKENLPGYNEFRLEDVLRAIRYSYATIITLDTMLTAAKIKNNVIRIYKKIDA